MLDLVKPSLKKVRIIMNSVFGISVFGILVIIIPLISGVLLIVFSKGKAKSYPACGKCGYDVSGSVGAVSRCPECGLDFTVAGINPAGDKRNPLMLTSGIILLVLSLGCFSSLFLANSSRVRQQTIVAPAPPPQPTAPTPVAPPQQQSPSTDQSESD